MPDREDEPEKRPRIRRRRAKNYQPAEPFPFPESQVIAALQRIINSMPPQRYDEFLQAVVQRGVALKQAPSVEAQPATPRVQDS